MKKSYDHLNLPKKNIWRVFLGCNLILAISIVLIDGFNYFFSIPSKNSIGYPLSIILSMIVFVFFASRLAKRIQWIGGQTKIDYRATVTYILGFLIAIAVVEMVAEEVAIKFRLRDLQGRLFGNYIGLSYQSFDSGYDDESGGSNSEDQFLLKVDAKQHQGRNALFINPSDNRYYLKKRIDGEIVDVKMSQEYFVFYYSGIASGYHEYPISTEGRIGFFEQIIMGPIYILDLLFSYMFHFSLFTGVLLFLLNRNKEYLLEGKDGQAKLTKIDFDEEE